MCCAGTLPQSYLQNFTSLRTLNVAENNLQGQLPVVDSGPFVLTAGSNTSNGTLIVAPSNKGYGICGPISPNLSVYTFEPSPGSNIGRPVSLPPSEHEMPPSDLCPHPGTVWPKVSVCSHHACL